MCFVSLLTLQLLTSSNQYLFLFSIDENAPYLLEDPVLCAIAEKHKQTPALISLQYLLHCGIVIVVKSFNEKRIKESMKVKSRLWASGLLHSVCPVKTSLQASSSLVLSDCPWWPLGTCAPSAHMSIFFSTLALWVHSCKGLGLTGFQL